MNSSLGFVSTSGSGGVAAPKPSSFNNPSFFFQRFSKKPSFSLSPPAANRPKSIGKTVSCSNREEEDVGGFTYKGAGVDIDAGSELVRRIAKMTPGIGGFGGLIPLGDDYLVHSTDGVGTKLMLAIETGIYETIGIDLVAMCVNDIVTSGAKPLSFQDQYSTGHLDVDLAEKVIKGIVDGCKQSGCPLTGGEGSHFFNPSHLFEISHFDCLEFKPSSTVNKRNHVKCACDFACVESSPLDIGGARFVVGPFIFLLRLWSTCGNATVGTTRPGIIPWLVIRVLAQSGLSLKDQLPGGSGKPITLGKALMAPTVIYVKQVLDIISKGGVKGVAHITGGGFTDNIPRIFPKGLGATIYRDSWEVPAVFKWIQEAGRIEDTEMRRTFNMGIGMVLVVSPGAAARILREQHGGYSAYRIGEVTSREGVTYK